jgi:hypothetical protein
VKIGGTQGIASCRLRKFAFVVFVVVVPIKTLSHYLA